MLKKPLAFKDLPDQAKEEAAENVHEKEYAHMDWSHESQMITEDIKQMLEEAELKYGEVYWSTDYHVKVDLSSVKITDDFLKRVLEEEEFQKLQDIEVISEGLLEHHIFDKDCTKKYVLSFDYYSDMPSEKGIKFLMKYSQDEEQKNDFAFPLLMEAWDLSETERKKLFDYIIPIAKKFEDELETSIRTKVNELEEKIVKMIEAQNDYYESTKFYFDNLEAESWLADKYRFSETGEIVSIDGEIEVEFEDEYEGEDEFEADSEEQEETQECYI